MPPISFELILASRNAKKSGEIRELLAPHGIRVLSVSELPDVPDVVEDGTSFAENAAKKASQTAKHLNRWTIGEDSGLRVDALHGAPGIYSARFSGPDATDESNNAKLLKELEGVPPERRGAEYACHVAVADPQGRIRVTREATCRGRITEHPRGTNGFGYDPYFEIREYHRTFGELRPIVKRCLSHRARAFQGIIRQLLRVLSEESGDGR